MGIASESQQKASTQSWRRLGEVEIDACEENDLSNTTELTAQTLEAMRNAFTPILSSEGMLAALEGAVLDALARKWANGGVPCRLIISALNSGDGEGDGDASHPANWSFFVIERPAAPNAPAVEIVELRLYHE